MSNPSLALWRAKNYLRSISPYVKREKFQRVTLAYEELLAALPHTPRASTAKIRSMKPPRSPMASEVCLFVTHADRPGLKRHVADHIAHLLAAGIEVVLIANSDLDDLELSIEPALMTRLLAAHARENLGFDFAAWSHALQLLRGHTFERIYLVNDSIAGPLDAAAFGALMQRVRESPADLVGLTENARPKPHLQSYFLVFSRRAQHSAAWHAIFDDALAFASKEHVIAVYETQLTAVFEAAGLSTMCLFPDDAPDPRLPDYIHYRWRELIERGMPFVKTSVLRKYAAEAAMRSLVPEAYRRDLVPDDRTDGAPT